MIHRFFLIICSVLSLCGIAQEKPTDYLQKDFFQQRRTELRKQLPSNSVAVFFTNPVRNRANDVDYVYHQNPDFYYFTGYKEPDAVLLIFSEKQNIKGFSPIDEIIFVRPRDSKKELWNGKRLGVTGVKEELGFDAILPNTEFKALELDFGKFDKVLHPHLHHDVRDDENDSGDLFNLIEAFEIKTGYTATENHKKEHLQPIKNTDEKRYHTITASLRERKTEEELVLLKKAVEISCIGQIEVMKAMHPGMSETEIQGIHEFVFKKYGAEYEGYPSIVGAGNNGCILHYIDNIKPMVNNELVLMDLGAEYHGYTADVTRTIPANGKFSEEQRAIYELVYKAQEAAIRSLKPGQPFFAANEESKKEIIKGLKALGIIKSDAEYRQYLPHGISHHIGLDVHDKTTYGPLEENMVITIEPGIYIPDGSPCDEKWWGIGVRIEDDILITKDGWINLSESAPRTVEAIENMMAQPSVLDQLVLPELD